MAMTSAKSLQTLRPTEVSSVEINFIRGFQIRPHFETGLDQIRVFKKSNHTSGRLAEHILDFGVVSRNITIIISSILSQFHTSNRLKLATLSAGRLLFEFITALNLRGFE